MSDQIHVLGEGGSVILMDLPLPRHIQERVDKGYLRIVTPTGAPKDPERSKPAINDPKKAWVGWAVWKSRKDNNPISPDDAEGMTKQDLIDRFA